MCRSKPRKFTKKDGYSERDLLHYAVDHLKAANILFKESFELYDSAGYLSHLGIEMIFKTMLLYREGAFPGIHKLGSLVRRLKNDISLSEEQIRLIKKLDKFEGLRYPSPKKTVEIGDEDWNEIKSFIDFLFQNLPKKLQDEFSKIDSHTKGGRTLMSKPKKH